MGVYAGDVGVTEAWGILSTQNDSILIDVRTPAEWQFTGVPSLRHLGKEVFFIPWLNYPTFEFNDRFFSTFDSMNISPEQTILLLCKVGGRSHAAAVALAEKGYTKTRSIETGFEGEHNEFGQRGKISGWKAAGLPWEQS